MEDSKDTPKSSDPKKVESEPMRNIAGEGARIGQEDASNEGIDAGERSKEVETELGEDLREIRESGNQITLEDIWNAFYHLAKEYYEDVIKPGALLRELIKAFGILIGSIIYIRWMRRR